MRRIIITEGRMTSVRARGIIVSMIAGFVLATATGAATAQTKLKVIVFPTLANLAQYAAQAQGYYSKRGLEVELIATPNSDETRQGLAQGRYQIAHGGVDNAVAQVENDKTDLFIFQGGNNGFNSLIVQPEVASYEDLRGKTLAVDSPVTAFAILMYKMLDLKGLHRGDYMVKGVGGSPQRFQALAKDKTYAGSILNLPFTMQAQDAGLKNLGAAIDVVGPYQSDGGWVLRSWAKANEDTLVHYIQANIEGIRFALDPANTSTMSRIVSEQLKLSPEMAMRSMHFALDQKGFATDAKFDMEGFGNALKLRAEMLGTWGGTPPAPEKYLDLSYYQRALAGL
jgi:ABC-type nitrate/sulfonate/bicarbonate transport system substrate-binding protein